MVSESEDLVLQRTSHITDPYVGWYALRRCQLPPNYPCRHFSSFSHFPTRNRRICLWFFFFGEFSIRFLFCIERKHVRPCKRQTHQRYLFGFFAIRRRKVCCATILVLVSSEHTNYSCDWTVKQGDYLIVYASHSFH